MRAIVILAGLLAWGDAWASTGKLAVVPLDAPPDLTFVGRSLAEALAAEARRAGQDVVPPDEAERLLGRDGLAQLARCGDDPRCHAQRGEPLGVERLVGGWVQRAGDRYVVGVVLVDLRGGQRLAAFRREVPIASRRLKDDVVLAAGSLLRGEADAAGTLRIDATVPGAAVAIDGRPAGTTPLSRKVEPGRHRVQVSKDGHAPADPIYLVVPAGGVAEHVQVLHPLPARERGNDAPAAGAETRVEVLR